MTLDVPLTYLATDALDEGVGASQVLAYVERFAAAGVEVHLHTFEKRSPSTAAMVDLDGKGVRWTPHPFGRFGPRGGLDRLVRGARAVRDAELVHARADLAAASVLLARSDRWVFDVRGLFADQRLALGTLRKGSPEHRALRWVEGASARRCSALVTLTRAILPVLEARHGSGIAGKAKVVTTCVDTGRFALVETPPMEPLQLLLAGSLNRYYDVPAMVSFTRAVRRRRATSLVLATPGPTAWEAELATLAPKRIQVLPAEMPAVIAASHAGLSVCRQDAGISLLGAMPTKIGEFLATGRPVIVNAGLGDAGELLRDARAGVVLHGTSDVAIETAVDDLESLLEDPGTPLRCRDLALKHFDLDAAAETLLATYRRISA